MEGTPITQVNNPNQAHVPTRACLRQWVGFFVIGVLLYLALYAWAEIQVRTTGQKNRFFMIATAPPQKLDFVILGASHAMPLGFGDTEAQFEARSGATIMNLSNEGAGVLPNLFVYDYFSRRHSATNVIYVVDSFAFYSSEWNEDRLTDSDLFRRAPLDRDLIATFLAHPWSRGILPEYLSGFAKINGLYRLGSDIPDAESRKFTRTYRPNKQIDKTRIDYLFASEDPQAAIEKYLGDFAELIARVQASGADFIAVKLPTPPRYRDRLPGEAAFDAKMATILDSAHVEMHDFSGVLPGDEFYYDTDHLNLAGVEAVAGLGLTDLLVDEK
jgi:hypothetical protein